MNSSEVAAAWQSLLPGLEQLRAKWPMGGWTWDDRLCCISSSFTADLAEEARNATSLATPVEWTSKTIRQAPARVVDLAERTGGVRDAQLVLTSSDVTGIFVYGLWWPWGSRQHISHRVGLAGIESDEAPYPKFRELFRVEV